MIKRPLIVLLPAVILVLSVAAADCRPAGFQTVDFLKCAGLKVNAAGPFLLEMDQAGNRLIAANTLSSSITIIDCGNERVRNIPIGGRGLQHLKSEALALCRRSGRICLIGTKSIHIADPGSDRGISVKTSAQFESAAVCAETGNIFLAGRETGKLGFYHAESGKMRDLAWLDRSESLGNLNATPPPPIRKVVADNVLKTVVALDGYTSTIYTFDSSTGDRISSRGIPVKPAARWHLAGYDEDTHYLYLVVENSGREVVAAAKIDTDGYDDTVVELPGYREGVGITYNRARDEVYIPYDNHPSVHAVDFKSGGDLFEIKIPAYGNDASAVDQERGILYVASWAHGEIDVIDLEKRKLTRRIKGLGIIPHMFTMAFNPDQNTLYFPKGATAVNGTFGAAMTAVDPETGDTRKIRTGWAPVDLIEIPARNSFLVFNSEDMFAEVEEDGNYDLISLPQDYPIKSCPGPAGEIYLSYGPHQSYWPVVYIWGAGNGVLGIDSKTLEFYDRRIVRQALDMAMDESGILYLTQNNWGRENQFIARLLDQVRLFDPGQRIELADTVQRETTQRVLEYDSEKGLIYLLRAGETDERSSVLQVIDPDSSAAVAGIETGLNSTGLAFDSEYILAASFGSGEITAVRKSDYQTANLLTGGSPLKIIRGGGSFWAIDHTGRRMIRIGTDEIKKIFSRSRRIAGEDEIRFYDIGFEGLPDNIFFWNGRPVISAHSGGALRIIAFDTEEEDFETLIKFEYPFGETSFDTANSSFYMRGQFGDAVFSLCRMRKARNGRLWITDFLAGKLFILDD